MGPIDVVTYRTKVVWQERARKFEAEVLNYSILEASLNYNARLGTKKAKGQFIKELQQVFDEFDRSLRKDMNNT